MRAIAIRQLSATEQILAHGTATLLRDNADLRWEPPVVPEVAGADGDELSPQVKQVIKYGTIR